MHDVGSGVTAICVARNDANNLRKALCSIREHVDEIIVTVQPSEDDTIGVAQEYADRVITTTDTFYIEMHFESMQKLAKYPVIFNIDADEIVVNPHRIRELAAMDYDIWWFRRTDQLNGKRVQFMRDDKHPRMFRKGNLKWQRKMHTYPECLSSKQCEVVECWIVHDRSSTHIKRRQAEYAANAVANGESNRVIPMQNAFLERVTDYEARIEHCQYPRRILLSYNGLVGIGDTIMTTPAVREIRRQYPNAEITYLTQKGDTLKYNPYIDRIDSTKPEHWSPKLEEKYDIVVHWECSLTGEAGKRVNGYELESYWAHVVPDNFHGDFFLGKNEIKGAKKFISRHVKTPKVVGMVLSASCIHRTWPYSEAFVMRLLEEHEDTTIIFFGESHTDILQMRYSPDVREVKDEWGCTRYVHVPYDGPGADRIIRTAGFLTFREACALIGELDCLVCPDSGLMHVAAALDVPTVAYFNLVPPDIRVKHCPTVIPVFADYECSPCFVHGTIACQKTTQDGAPCLRGVSVDMMLDPVRRILNDTIQYPADA
jgi:ADP-heptose:LPS heptosyltransferase